jgi:hypothetical protein
MQHGERLRPQPDCLAIGPPQFGAPLIKLKTGKPEHRTHPFSGFCAQRTPNIRKTSECHWPSTKTPSYPQWNTSGKD